MRKRRYRTCVSVAGADPAGLARAVRTEALGRADYAEARLDFLRPEEIPDALELLRGEMARIVCTVRPEAEGGRFPAGREAERVAILKLAAEYGPFLLDVELGTLRRDASLGRYVESTGTKMLVSWHDFGRTPGTARLREVLGQMARHSPRSKVVCMARSQADSARMLGLYAGRDDPQTSLISFAMGRHGRLSRVLCLCLGSPYTYASPAGGDAVAPGQIGIDELNRIIGTMAGKAG